MFPSPWPAPALPLPQGPGKPPPQGADPRRCGGGLRVSQPLPVSFPCGCGHSAPRPGLDLLWETPLPCSWSPEEGGACSAASWGPCMQTEHPEPQPVLGLPPPFSAQRSAGTGHGVDIGGSGAVTYSPESAPQSILLPQRPLGTCPTPVQVGPVPATTPSDGTPQG